MVNASVLSIINDAELLISPVIRWLQSNYADPRRLVAYAMNDLRRRGRSLPLERRAQYAKKVLHGEFLARWTNKHCGQSFDKLIADPDWVANELRPFEFAVIAVGDENAFTRLAPRFARKRMVEYVGLSIGTAEDFASYVTQNTRHLAHLFLKNFDARRRATARKAVRYMQMTAASWYLVKRTRPIRTNAPNLEAYIEQSSRLKRRTVLAIKLAYLPALLSKDERAALRDRYGFTGSLGPRVPIKDIALLLRYKNPAALSRKLYRVRQWCRRHTPLETEVLA